MPEESRYILPKNKPNNAGLKIVVMFLGATFAIAFGFGIWDSWIFNHMTTAQHLWEARRASQSPDSIGLALRHVGAIPANSAEASEAKVLGAALRAQEASTKAAQTQRQEAANAARNARAAAITQLSSDLKNLGYDLSVEASAEVPGELVITSSEFGDTDHRVRFLSFVRGSNSPVAAACWSGFGKVRLRSSKVPLLGFDESYSLECYK